MTLGGYPKFGWGGVGGYSPCLAGEVQKREVPQLWLGRGEGRGTPILAGGGMGRRYPNFGCGRGPQLWLGRGGCVPPFPSVNKLKILPSRRPVGVITTFQGQIQDTHKEGTNPKLGAPAYNLTNVSEKQYEIEKLLVHLGRGIFTNYGGTCFITGVCMDGACVLCTSGIIPGYRS